MSMGGKFLFIFIYTKKYPTGQFDNLSTCTYKKVKAKTYNKKKRVK